MGAEMTRAEMTERPIEDIGPDWIGASIEVDDGKGATVGFRLGRYERTTVDDKPQWRLFSDQPTWNIKVPAGSKLRFSPTAGDPGIKAPSSHLQAPPISALQPPAPPVTVPPAPAAPRGPQSWVTTPPRS